MFGGIFEGFSPANGSRYYRIGGKHHVYIQLDSKEEVIKKLREMADDLEKGKDKNDSGFNDLKEELKEIRDMIKDLSNKKK